MGLIENAKRDWKQIVSNTNQFGVAITFTAPNATTADIVGLAIKHHLRVDEEGNPVNGLNARVTISESDLTTLGYPTRNASGEVDLKGHKVTFTDSTDTSGTYIINEWYPDETVGVITCILGTYAAT